MPDCGGSEALASTANENNSAQNISLGKEKMKHIFFAFALAESPAQHIPKEAHTRKQKKSVGRGEGEGEEEKDGEQGEKKRKHPCI